MNDILIILVIGTVAVFVMMWYMGLFEKEETFDPPV